MKAPEGLETLLDYGIIQEVVRPLMSGKEAQVYVVVAGGEPCVAKVYKEATQRTFRQRADYTEGRRTRNSRDQRAITKRTRHGRKKDEDAWRSAEVDMLYRLRDAGVRVPEPINFVEGVLVMELVKGADGNPAPRLGDQGFSKEEARRIYQQLLRDAIRMLCAGVIHGDLSEFNVLVGVEGPVVIDFPQAVDPTQNRNGEKLFLRDIENLHRFLARCAPGDPILPYGEEIWQLYQANKLDPETKLGGRYRKPEGKADTREVMALIEDAHSDRARRGVVAGPRKRGRSGDAYDGDGDDEDAEDFEGDPRARVEHSPSSPRPSSPSPSSPPPLKRVVDFSEAARPKPPRGRRAKKPAGDRASANRPRRSGSAAASSPSTASSGSASSTTTARPASPKNRRRRPSTSSNPSTASASPAAGGKPDARRDVSGSAGAGAGAGEGRAAPRKRRRRGRRAASTESGPSSRNEKSTANAGTTKGRATAPRESSKGRGEATDAPPKAPRNARPAKGGEGPSRPRRRRSRRRSAPE